MNRIVLTVLSLLATFGVNAKQSDGEANEVLDKARTVSSDADVREVIGSLRSDAEYGGVDKVRSDTSPLLLAAEDEGVDIYNDS